MRHWFIAAALTVCAVPLSAQRAPVILNEYNAVKDDGYLNGGDALSDIDGNASSDARFGRVAGNGGDWFELVVTEDGLDMRRWVLELSWFDESKNMRQAKILRLTDDPLWSGLWAGTIITVAESVPEDVSYDPARGDWWINVRVNKKQGSGRYIERADFKVNANEWRLTIRDASGAVRFGPAGEGIFPDKGINSGETFRLEADPSPEVTAASPHYNDGRDSTFGAPNRWRTGIQDFGALRRKAAERHGEPAEAGRKK